MLDDRSASGRKQGLAHIGMLPDFRPDSGPHHIVLHIFPVRTEPPGSVASHARRDHGRFRHLDFQAQLAIQEFLRLKIMLSRFPGCANKDPVRREIRKAAIRIAYLVKLDLITHCEVPTEIREEVQSKGI
jgi:hypothetical protein